MESPSKPGRFKALKELEETTKIALINAILERPS
jgi:hypothetical protein